MKYNYPVKYAAMPIIEQVGWSQGLNELERNYDVICYIVSKCYLLSDKTKYKENGKKEKEYEVVFPYQKGEYQTAMQFLSNVVANRNTTPRLKDKSLDLKELLSAKLHGEEEA